MQSSNPYLATSEASSGQHVVVRWQWSVWRIIACLVGALWLSVCTVDFVAVWWYVLWPESPTIGVYPEEYADIVFAHAVKLSVEAFVFAIPALATIGYCIFASRR